MGLLSKQRQTAPPPISAGMMELVDMRDLGSRASPRWGSSPHARTTSPRTTYRSRRLFYKSHLSLILSRLLSKPDPLSLGSGLGPPLRGGFFLSQENIDFNRLFQKGRHGLWSCLPFWVPAAEGGLHPSVIQMLGGSEFRLRRGFACGKTLVRRKSVASQNSILRKRRISAIITETDVRIGGRCRGRSAARTECRPA